MSTDLLVQIALAAVSGVFAVGLLVGRAIYGRFDDVETTLAEMRKSLEDRIDLLERRGCAGTP